LRRTGDELLDYVYEHWGTEHVAMIGSFITMHARLAVREVAKVFGVPPGEWTVSRSGCRTGRCGRF